MPRQKSYMKDQKVDDEDGHYIVVPDADLTERCMYRHSLPIIGYANSWLRHNNQVAWPGHLWQSRRGI